MSLQKLIILGLILFSAWEEEHPEHPAKQTFHSPFWVDVDGKHESNNSTFLTHLKRHSHIRSFKHEATRSLGKCSV